MQLKRLSRLTLDDLYAHRLAAPLSLQDFELYLVHRTKSVENLYFDTWFRQYSAVYASWCGAKVDAPSTEVVRDACHLGLSFLDPDNPLELNLTGATRFRLRSLAAQLSSPLQNGEKSQPCLPPSAFKEALRESRVLLAASFREFLLDRRGNSHARRNIASQVAGVILVVASLLPLVICSLLGAPKPWRLLGLPFTFWGVAQVSSARRRTCLLIYLGGGRRQAYGYEQSQTDGAAPSFDRTSTSLREPPPAKLSIVASSRLSTTSTRCSDPSGSPSIPPSPFSFSSVSSAGCTYSPATSSTIMRLFSHSSLAYWPPHRAASDPSVYFSPASDDKLIERLSRSSGKQTLKQECPLVRREQLRSLAYASVAGFAATLVMLVLDLTIPNRP